MSTAASPILEQETSGYQHPFAITALSSLAYIYGREGRFDEVLDLRIRTLGKTRPQTMSAMLDLSHGYMATDQPGRAVEILECLVSLER